VRRLIEREEVDGAWLRIYIRPVDLDTKPSDKLTTYFL